jgi:carbon-monoxide dehydrogenase small subunit
MKINFILNNEPQEIEVEPDKRVIDLVREDFKLTGTKEGCGTGECGVCSILVNGESKLSCLMLAAQLEDQNIITIEGIDGIEKYNSLLDKFVEKGAIQCGYCTPGMIISAVDLLNRNTNPDRQEIRTAISGNLCRCTGYQKIIDAIESHVEDEGKKNV